MAALVFDDAAQEVFEHRVSRLADESSVARQRRELVDGADGQVDGGEVFEEPRAGHRR